MLRLKKLRTAAFQLDGSFVNPLGMESSSPTAALSFSFRDGRAIERFSEDTLGRKQFARFFSEAITRHHGKESLTLAINAPWGDGKTSLKNMVTNVLEQEYAERILTLTFTPWEWASQNQVSEAFFAEIAKQFEIKDNSEAARDAAKRLRILGQYLGLAGNIISPAGFFTETILPGSSLVTVALGKGLGKAKELATNASDEMEKVAEFKRKSLPQIKEELRKSLTDYVSTQRKLLLIVIDDVDRLNPDEIRLVFQMIRVNADFPGVIFLLLYDEAYVVRALEKFFGGDTRRFLEKIVQFQVGLPIMIENQLRDHIISELNKIFAARPAYTQLFDLERFKSLWQQALGYYINNLRHASRILSSFQFHLGVFKSNEAEINPIDLFLLEILRLFEPAVYDAILKFTDELFPSWDISMVVAMRETIPNTWEETLNEMVKGATADMDSARILLKALFPSPSPRNAPYGPTVESQQLARERRACHILYFNRYVRLAIDSDDISDQRVSDLVRLFDRPTAFVGEMKALGAEGKLALAMTKLLARDNLQPSEKPIEMISGLCGFGETPDSSKPPPGLIGAANAVYRLIELQVPVNLTALERFERLAGGIRSSNAIHVPIEIARSEDAAEHQYAKGNETERHYLNRPMDRSEVDKLNNLVAERLEERIKGEHVDLSSSWENSLRWYIEFAPERAKKNADLLLSKVAVLKVLLHAVIQEQVAQNYNDFAERFAQYSLFLIQNVFGLDRFDKALANHEAALLAGDQGTVKRFKIYRDMRNRFSDRIIRHAPTGGNMPNPSHEKRSGDTEGESDGK